MMVYRIAKTRHIHDLSGFGARLFGGRWNKKGMSVIYTSESISLATVEHLVHVPFAIVPNVMSIATLKIANSIKPRTLNITDLPSNWRDYPSPPELAEIGTKWVLSKKSLMLRVPSAIIKFEHNVLINPSHSHMKHVKVHHVVSYKIDHRLLREQKS